LLTVFDPLLTVGSWPFRRRIPEWNGHTSILMVSCSAIADIQAGRVQRQKLGGMRTLPLSRGRTEPLCQRTRTHDPKAAWHIEGHRPRYFMKRPPDGMAEVSGAYAMFVQTRGVYSIFCEGPVSFYYPVRPFR
jgi:hypothetical protein